MDASAPASMSTSTSTELPPLPHIHLLCMHKRFADAFTQAVTSVTTSTPSPLPFTYTIHTGTLSSLPPTVDFNLMVSPANSYSLLDGGFDDAISRFLSPRRDYYALTRYVQRHLHTRWRGYLPPGQTEIVPLPAEWTRPAPRDTAVPGSWTPDPPTRNVWGCRYLAMSPTMRVPKDATGDVEVVYECVWSLLCAVDEHNRRCVAAGPGANEVVVESLLTTPLGTGVGGISAQRWAEQTVLALRHYAEARVEGSRWSALHWDAVNEIDQEIERTWADAARSEARAA